MSKKTQRRFDDLAWRLDEILGWIAFGNLDLHGSHSRARRQLLYRQSPSSELMRFEDEGGAVATREPQKPLAALPEAEEDLRRKLLTGELVLFDRNGNDVPRNFWAAHYPRRPEPWLRDYWGRKEGVLALWPDPAQAHVAASAPASPAAVAAQAVSAGTTPAEASAETAPASRSSPVTERWADEFAKEYMDSERAAGRRPTQCGLEDAVPDDRRGGRSYLRAAFHRLQREAGIDVKPGPPKKLN